MTDLTSLTLAQARDALRRREFSATELAEAHLAAIEKARALNAFVLETPDRAREMARLADARLAKGEGGPLAGLPLGVKDVFCTADVRTTACSHILDNFVPAYESTVTASLWRDGAAAFASCVGSEGPILCEASLFMRHIGAAFFGNLSSLIDIHIGETTPSSSLWGHWKTLCGTESGADANGTRRLTANDQQFQKVIHRAKPRRLAI